MAETTEYYQEGWEIRIDVNHTRKAASIHRSRFFCVDTEGGYFLHHFFNIAN